MYYMWLLNRRYVLVFLFFLMMMQGGHLKQKKKQASSSGDRIGRKPCIIEKIISEQLQIWKNTDVFQYYVPKTSCIVCSKPKCAGNCPEMAKETKMNIYNNLFEFGLFAFNLADKNIFRTFINKICYFKIEITPHREDRKICITIFQCEVKDGTNECGLEVYSHIQPRVDFSKDCVFVALAFIEEKQLHYSISFDCTYIPSTLLSANKTIPLTSKYCYIEKGGENQYAEFVYTDDEVGLPNGISVILPCSSGGFAFNTTTGRIMSGESCSKLLRNETEVEGMEFLLTKLYNDTDDWLVPHRPSFFDWMLNASALTPVYVDRNNKWKTHSKMKLVKKTNPATKNKIRRGCNFVDKPPKGQTFPPPPRIEAEVTLGKIQLPENEGPILDHVPKKSTLKPAPTSGFGGAADTSRGSLNFLSIKMKLIMLASNFGIIYHL